MRFRVRICLALFLLSSSGTPTQGQDDRPTFRTSTNLIVIPVVVKDAKGQFVFGLTREDFELSEDGRRQDIVQFGNDHIPVSLGVVIDMSGSMSDDARTPQRWADTRRAFELLVKRLNSEDEVFLAAFRDEPALAVPWTRDHGRIVDAFDSLAPGGTTHLFKAMAAITPMFQSAKHRRKVLLLISDGQDNTPPPAAAPGTSSSAPVSDPEWRRHQMEAMEEQRAWRLEHDQRVKYFASARDTINRTEVWVYAIGLGTRGGKVDEAVLRRLTDGTGGYVESVRSSAELGIAVSRVCDDLRAQYLLGFEPTRADGKFHKVSVRTKDRSFRSRARDGYLAP